MQVSHCLIIRDHSEIWPNESKAKNSMKYFLIAGNTRVGSTWLQACMNSLPGVYCTREIRWKMPYFDQAPLVHNYVDDTTRSMRERLEYGLRTAGAKNVTAVGAKLKFDPYGFVRPAAFEKLGRIMEDDISIVMLRRSYFEIFATWKAFGIRHLANPNERKNLLSGKPNKGDQEERKHVNRFHTVHSVPLEQTKLILTRQGKMVAKVANFLSRMAHASDRDQAKLLYPIEDAIQDLFVLFFNDIFMLSLLRGRKDAHVVDYNNIESEFYPFARKFTDVVSPEDCQDILKYSPTRKIESDGVQLVFPDGALIEISNYLDHLFNDVKNDKLSINSVIRYDDVKDSVSFFTPDMYYIFQKHEETKNFPLKILKNKLIHTLFWVREKGNFWESPRQVYLPVANAS